jgi:hypothetical protein
MPQPPPLRDLGPQPLAQLMHRRGLKAADLVAASGVQRTHKAVQRGMRARWLTLPMRDKIRRALARCTGEAHALDDLFTYAWFGALIVLATALPTSGAVQAQETGPLPAQVIEAVAVGHLSGGRQAAAERMLDNSLEFYGDDQSVPGGYSRPPVENTD